MQIQLDNSEIVAAIATHCDNNGLDVSNRQMTFSVKRDGTITATLSEPTATAPAPTSDGN
jgi:hypothetical protein